MYHLLLKEGRIIPILLNKNQWNLIKTTRVLVLVTRVLLVVTRVLVLV